MKIKCPFCNSESLKVHQHNGHAFSTMYRCVDCGRFFSERRFSPYSGLKLRPDKITRVLTCLLEGNSIRATERIGETHRDTIMRLLIYAGECSKRAMDRTIRNVKSRLIQVDEIWDFCGRKAKHCTQEENRFGKIGDAWCFVSTDPETKLVHTYRLGKRDTPTATAFMVDLKSRLAIRPQLTTDGLRSYLDAVESAFGAEVDYAMLVKIFSGDESGRERYSPSQFVEAVPSIVNGNPDVKFICTSHAERNNLTIRMQMRRLTRLTNGFSKKWENLDAAFALHFGYYNLCRLHGTIRTTPAMEAGLTDHIWNIEELLNAGKMQNEVAA